MSCDTGEYIAAQASNRRARTICPETLQLDAGVCDSLNVFLGAILSLEETKDAGDLLQDCFREA